MPSQVTKPLTQNLKKYNRESGKKTLVFFGIILALVVILTFFALYLLTKPQVLTSSLESKQPALSSQEEI